MKFTQTEYGNSKEILMFKDHYVPMSVVMDDSGITADANGKKIVPKGTLVGGASASIFADRSQKVRIAHDYAKLETAMTGDNNDVMLTAKADGTAGADISLTLMDPAGNSKELSVGVSGKDIVASLATSSSGAITTTASELIAAINGNADAAALVTASLKGSDTGAGVVTALAKTSLSNSAVTGVSVIDGVLLDDVDVTYGPKTCSLLIHGFVKTDALPASPTSAQKAAFASGMQISFIEH